MQYKGSNICLLIQILTYTNGTTWMEQLSFDKHLQKTVFAKQSSNTRE